LLEATEGEATHLVSVLVYNTRLLRI
jgi:hypothetical protein